MVVNLSVLPAQDLNRFPASQDLVRKIKDHIPGKESKEERRIFILTATAVLIMRNKE